VLSVVKISIQKLECRMQSVECVMLQMEKEFPKLTKE
jgi:hypothetical protein